MKKIFSYILVILLIIIFTNTLYAKTQIKVWAMGEEGKKIQQLARSFEKENPDIEVITQAIPWVAAHEKLVTAVVGNIPPDVCQLGTTWLPEFAAMGALEPLQKYADKSKIVNQESFFKGSWKTGFYNKKLYGIPWYVDTRVLYYRKDIFEKAGIKLPIKTWDQFKLLCERLKSKIGDKDYVISLPYNDAGTLAGFVWQNNSSLLNSDFTEPNFKDKKFEEALRYYLTFFKNKWTPLEEAADVDLFDAFRKGKYASFISGPWMVSLVSKECPEIEGKWDLMPMPGNPNSSSFVGGCNLSVFKLSKHKQASWKFVEYLSRPDIQVLWHKITTDLPSVIKAWEDPLLKNNKKISVFGEQLKTARPIPPIPEWAQIEQSINKYLEEAVYGINDFDGPISEYPLDPIISNLNNETIDILTKHTSNQSALYKFSVSIAVFIFIVGLILFFILRKSKKTVQKTGGIDVRSHKNMIYIPYIFIGPAVLLLVVFLFAPVIVSFIMSITDWNIYVINNLSRINITWFDNYIKVIHDPIFWKSLRNTFLFVIMGVPAGVILSMLAAVMLNQAFVKLKSFFRVGYFLPVVTTMVAVAVVWRWMYNYDYGLMNYFFTKLGFAKQKWLSDVWLALPSLTLMAVWKGFGYNMVIFLAGLQSIPKTYYEAAEIDGAGTLDKFLNVTVPLLAPTTVFVVIMSTIGSFQLFAEPYIMTKGGPLDSTMSIVLYMYNHGFKFYNLGYASAIAYILFFIIVLFTLIQLKFTEKEVQY